MKKQNKKIIIEREADLDKIMEVMDKLFTYYKLNNQEVLWILESFKINLFTDLIEDEK